MNAGYMTKLNDFTPVSGPVNHDTVPERIRLLLVPLLLVPLLLVPLLLVPLLLVPLLLVPLLLLRAPRRPAS
jgi:hypothetical protein